MRSIFQKCPRCGAGELKWPDERHFECGVCGLVLYRNITSAVAGFLIDPAGRLLLVERAREPAKGMLAIPGGFIDAGECAEAALRREIREEVGLEAGALKYLCTAPNVYHYREVRYEVLDLFFVGEMPGFEGARALDEIAGLVIQPLHEVDLARIAFPSIRGALQRLRERRLPRAGRAVRGAGAGDGFRNQN